MGIFRFENQPESSTNSQKGIFLLRFLKSCEQIFNLNTNRVTNRWFDAKILIGSDLPFKHVCFLSGFVSTKEGEKLKKSRFFCFPSRFINCWNKLNFFTSKLNSEVWGWTRQNLKMRGEKGSGHRIVTEIFHRELF